MIATCVLKYIHLLLLSQQMIISSHHKFVMQTDRSINTAAAKCIYIASLSFGAAVVVCVATIDAQTVALLKP